MKLAQKARSPFKRRDRKGVAAAEMALVAPLLVLIFFGIAQFGSIFFTRHTMMLAVREGARQMAIEGATVDEAKSVVEDYLEGFGINGVTITAQNAYKGNGDSAQARRVTVTAEIPAEQASLLGDVLNVFSSGSKIHVHATMRKEGELVAAPTTP
jgi:Flp pilus assembly protein TadG